MDSAEVFHEAVDETSRAVYFTLGTIRLMLYWTRVPRLDHHVPTDLGVTFSGYPLSRWSPRALDRLGYSMRPDLR